LDCGGDAFLAGAHSFDRIQLSSIEFLLEIQLLLHLPTKRPRLLLLKQNKLTLEFGRLVVHISPWTILVSGIDPLLAMFLPAYDEALRVIREDSKALKREAHYLPSNTATS